MTKHARFERVVMKYEVVVNGKTSDVELPFATGILADFAGTQASPKEIYDRAFVEVRADTFDACMRAMRPRAIFTVPDTLTGSGELAIDITFDGMADFAPAAILRKVEPLRALAEVRDRSAAEIDRRIARQLDPILRAEAIRQLERTWRGLHYLVSHTSTRDVRIRILNITKRELAHMLRRYRGVGWDQSPLFKKIYDQEYGTLGGTPFGCLVGDYCFDHGAADVEMLGEIGKVAAASHALFVAGAASTLFQAPSWSQWAHRPDLGSTFGSDEYAAWRALRASDTARHIALVMPPFQGGDPGNEAWVNAAYALAANIHRSFERNGWFSRTFGPEHGAIEGSPATEAAVDASAEAELAAHGLVALALGKYSDAAAFLSANTLHEPAASDEPTVTANARLAASVPYVLAVGRLAHYLNAIVRDKYEMVTDRRHVQGELDRWIADYVDGPGMLGWRPFASARIVADRPDGAPRSHGVKFWALPND
ncbi:MAG: type VI secretion system contractile sheath small subunit [Casimicrobiaceae bacterium]